ncbi:hypothetical protein KKA14_12470 [bacterium]|nr:hypothetical protein [bacterium]
MLVIITLIIISIFFPPAWFALAAYIGYLVLTKKQRRDRLIMFEIQKLIATGQEETILKHLYYDAAKSFAAEHGASMSPYKNDPEDDCLIIDMVIGGKEYSVCVQRWMKDETMLTVKTKSKSREDIVDSIGKDSFLAEILNKGSVSDEPTNETEGIEDKGYIIVNITQGVNSRISSERVALQFVLEELDAARQGNEAAVQFVKNSGFSPSEYEGAMQNSFEEVDGPDGPQQFLLSSVMQFASDMDFMVSLRLKVVEKIIHDWGLNKQEKGRTDNLLQSLRNILEDDDSVMPALTKNTPVPASARTRHVHFRQKNIDSAQNIVSTLTVITGDDVDTIIKNALQITPQEDDEISQDEIIAKLSRLSESEDIKTCRMSIQPINEIWSWDFEFSDEELEVANDLVSVLYDMRNGDFIAPVYNIVKQKKLASSSFDDFDDDIPF